jgi:HSP20 family protein
MSNLLTKTYFGSTFPNTVYTDFDSIFTPFMRQFNRTRGNDIYQTVPRANVYYRENDGYSIEMAVPGFAREDFNLDVENGTLTVSLNGKIEDTEFEKDSIRQREWSYSEFKRNFALPENTNLDSITARYDAGILYITVPVENQQNRRTRITVD